MAEFKPCAMSQTEFLRTNFFELAINEIGGFEIQNTNIPNWVVNPIEVGHGNIKTKHAGTVNVEDWEIGLLDLVDLSTSSKLQQWYELCYNWSAGGFLGLASSYKKDGTLTEYAPTGTEQNQYTLKGCWITNIQFGDLSYEDGDKKIMTVTLSVDCVEHL